MIANRRTLAGALALYATGWLAACGMDGRTHAAEDAVRISDEVTALVRSGTVFTPAAEDTLPWPGTIRKTRFDRGTGTIIAMDQLATTVVAFTPDGRFVRRFGGRGAGPGEFESVSDIALREDGLLAVLDRGNERVSLFEADGAYRGSFRVRSYESMTFTADGRLAFVPSRHDAAFDLYDLEGQRSSIGRAADLPYLCLDRLDPGPDCRVKRPCYMCHLVALGPDRLALVDRAGARVRLFDAAGAVVRTWDLASVEPMRTWRAQERERLQKFWDEGQRAHRSFVADALPLSERELVLSIVPHRPERNGRRLWVLDVESGEVRRFAWDTPSIGGTVAIGEDELFALDNATGAVLRYRCPDDPAASGAGTAPAKNGGHARSPAHRAHGCLSVRPESRSVTDRAS